MVATTRAVSHRPAELAAGAALAAAIALTIAPAPAVAAPSGAWTATTVVEPESVEETAAAAVTNERGFLLAVAREPGQRRVIGILRLPPADQDFLDDARPLEWSVDGGPTQVASRIGGGLKSCTFFLWDGEGEPVLGPLRDLMEASERIEVRYPLSGGGHKEIELAATGVKAAVSRVLGVTPEVSAEARELALERQHAIDGCLAHSKPKDRDRCLERLAACRDAATAAALRECAAAAKKK